MGNYNEAERVAKEQEQEKYSPEKELKCESLHKGIL